MRRLYPDPYLLSLCLLARYARNLTVRREEWCYQFIRLFFKQLLTLAWRRTREENTFRKKIHGASSYDVTGAQRRLESNEVIRKANNNNQRTDDSTNDDRNDEQTVYVIEFESESNEKDESLQKKGKGGSNDGDNQNPLDPWSIVWYIGSFGGLVAFFLIVSCSEWCCRRGGRPRTVPYTQRVEVINGGEVATETPPPPYHLFAPPPYDSVNYEHEIMNKTSGEKVDIYVISVPIDRPVVQAPV